VRSPLIAGIWRPCSGRGSAAAHGIRGRARNAAQLGHLRVLHWAREHHCPWDWATPAWAAAGGHMEVLQWVRENDTTGAIWNERQVRRCAGGLRKQEMLAWLDELSAPS
jgi:hypothetical protein